MTQVDQNISEIVTTQEQRRFAIKTHEQGAKLVDPSEGSFASEASFGDDGVEANFARCSPTSSANSATRSQDGTPRNITCRWCKPESSGLIEVL